MEKRENSTELNKNLLPGKGGAAAAENEEYFDLAEMFYVLLNHWKSLLLCFLIGAALAGFYHMRMIKPVYTAKTELYITSSDSVISLQDLQVGSALTADYQSIITSRAVLNQVIEDLQLNTNYKGLRKLISVSNPSGTHIISTSVSTSDLALSRDIANDLLVVSIDRIFQIVGTSEPTIIDYSEAQAVEDSTPGLTRYLLIGGILGALLVAAFLVVGMLRNNTLRTEDDVEKALQLPVLSAIPYYNND